MCIIFWIKILKQTFVNLLPIFSHFFFFGHTVHLASQLEMEPGYAAVEVQSPNHWLDCQASPYNHIIKLTKLLEGLMLKLKLQHSGYLIRRTDSLEKTLMLGKTEGERRRERQRMRCWMASPTQMMSNSMDMSLSELWELVMGREACLLQSMGLQRVRHKWETELNWKEKSTIM